MYGDILPDTGSNTGLRLRATRVMIVLSGPAWTGSSGTKQSRVASTAEEVQNGEYFQVEEILDSRRRGRRMEYLVKWERYGHEHDSWEPVAHFMKCPEMLQQFHPRTNSR